MLSDAKEVISWDCQLPDTKSASLFSILVPGFGVNCGPMNIQQGQAPFNHWLARFAADCMGDEFRPVNTGFGCRLALNCKNLF